MARRFSVFCLLVLVAAAAAEAQDSFQFGRLGTVPMVRPKGEPTQVALLFSGEKGIGPRETELAKALADAGTLVFEVDTHRYFTTGSHGKGGHLFPAVDMEALSQIGQKETGTAVYRQPFLIGTGAAGAGLAYVALAEAPPDTFEGAVSDGFCAVIPFNHLFRRGNGFNWDGKWKDGVHALPSPGLDGPWLVLENPAQPACPTGPAADFVKQIPAARMLPRPDGADGWKKQLAQALDILADQRRKAAARQEARGEMKDLPLTEVAPEGPAKDLLAVIVSGSGGYVGLDRRIGNQLAGRGVAAVGLSSLGYFWKRRDPAEAARDLGRILEHYFAAWHKNRAILIGYSQGADVLPFMISRLPANLRSKVAVVGLVGLDGGAQFDMHPDGWISKRPITPEVPAGPEIPKLKGMKVVCIYGSEENKTLCRTLPKEVIIPVEIPGDHGFEGDAPKIAERFIAEAMGAAPPPAPAAKGKVKGKG